MKNNIQLLDVTLRDGGYKTNFHFTLENVQNILRLLDQSNIQYIEVGYRNGPFKLAPHMGKSATCPRDYLEFCRKFICKAKLTVIFHPQNIQQNDLEEMRSCNVDAVRVCFSEQNKITAFKSIEMANKSNFEVFANITRVSHHSKKQIKEWVMELRNLDVKAVYLADSNGSMTPEEIKDLFSYLQAGCSVPFGFHAHDNLFLAQANAVAAINNDVQFIDASLFGFGKGAGNLRMEGIASFLHAQGHRYHDICKIIEAAEYAKYHLLDGTNNFIAKDIIMGIFDLSQDEAARLDGFSNINDCYLRASQY